MYTLRFFSLKCSLFHNSNLFGSCIILILYTKCAKIKKNNSGAKRLRTAGLSYSGISFAIYEALEKSGYGKWTTCIILNFTVRWVALSVWDLWWMQWHWLTFVSVLFGFPPICVIPPMLHTRISFTYPRRYVVLVIDKVSLDKTLVICYSGPGLNSWRPVVFVKFFRGFTQFLQRNVGIVHQMRSHLLLPYTRTWQFIAHNHPTTELLSQSFNKAKMNKYVLSNVWQIIGFASFEPRIFWISLPTVQVPTFLRTCLFYFEIATEADFRP